MDESVSPRSRVEHGADEQGEIRATGFNDQVDKFYDKLDEGKVSRVGRPSGNSAHCQVVFVSRARVQIAKKQFNHVNNEYEISFDNNSEVEPVSFFRFYRHDEADR
jgi:replication factor A1